MLISPAAVLSTVLLALTAFAPFASGAEVRDLYEAEVPVPSKSDADRVAALREAFTRVVVRITGLREPPASPRLQLALESAPTFVQQFEYRVAPVVDAESGAVTSGDRLWVRFDPAPVDAAIAEAGLPRWSRVRPETLLWVGVDDGGRTLLSADEPSGLATAIRRTASERGLPVVLPLLDLEDQMRVKVADVWAGFDERIREASRRYQPGAILVARIEPATGGAWTASLTLLAEGAAQRWRLDGPSPGAVLEEALQQTSDTLSARYTSASGDSGSVRRRARISAIASFADYTRTIGYLEQLDEVAEIQVESLDGDRVDLALTLRSGDAALRRLVELGVVLSETGAPSDERLEFRLLP